MGDKTQLATVALAAKYQSIIPIWMGTTAAMLAADAFGIIVGVVLGKRIPERFVKWFAAVIFILFGIIGLYDSMPGTIPDSAGNGGDGLPHPGACRSHRAAEPPP